MYLKNIAVNTNYPMVLDIQKTLETVRPDYADEIAGINRILAVISKGGSLSLNDHVKAMVLSMLSNMREWKPIEDNLSVLDSIFCHYEASKLKNKNCNEIVEEVKKYKCGNLRIKSQMKCLKGNIEVLERLEKEYGSLDRCYSLHDKYVLVDMLSNPKSPYKLREMGIPLICEYLKGVGIALVKPDRHVCRIIGRLGFSIKLPAGEIETLRICDKIAEELKMSHAMLDTVLWQYGVEKKCGICGEKPKCAQCGVISCPYRMI